MLSLLLLLSTAHAGECLFQVEGDRIPAAESGLFFHTAKAELTEASAEAVANVACLLALDPTLTVQIEVHTDSQGSGAYNLRMSQLRAEAVRTALVDKGADADRITAVGYGELYPVDTNSTAEGRGKNRRIELHTVDPSERPPRPDAPEPPAPAPAPAPEPTLDLCASARTLRADVVPDWPRTRCAALDGGGWQCTVDLPFAEVSSTLTGCLSGARVDGEELWLTMHAAPFVFRGAGGSTTLAPQ